MSLRVAVIGVGYLGRHHARILSTLPGAELVAVVDTNRARAEEIAAAHATRPFTDYRAVIGQVDAVCIAVPTELHRDIAVPFLSAGIPVLVEKPMARSLAEAEAMIAGARGLPAPPSPSGTPSGSTPRSKPRGRCWPIPGSSKSTVWARFPSGASTSTSSSI